MSMGTSIELRKVFRYKSRIQWLNSSDQNTKLFFIVHTLHGRSIIFYISNEDGSTIDDPVKVSESIVNYFQRL